jgi:hypothetical protein
MMTEFNNILWAISLIRWLNTVQPHMGMHQQNNILYPENNVYVFHSFTQFGKSKFYSEAS